MRVLVTGGAGFIGSFVVDALLKRGDEVRILDNLEPQVHGGRRPEYLNPEAEFVEGDVRDAASWEKCLRRVEAVIHCASAVGVGQSMYEVKRYTDVNVGGTANFLDLLANGKTTVEKVIVPTSMTAYGEGAYRCAEHGVVRPGLRRESQLQAKDWAPKCPQCEKPVEPVPTNEDAARQSGTVYALTKNAQEELVMNVCRTYGVAATALRLFNVYGPRQSLSNPYTGVTAIFLSRLKNNAAPVIYEDGLQSRDFVSVHDVARAFLLALDDNNAEGQVFNVGSGAPTPILEIAKTLGRVIGKEIAPELPGSYRLNDIRHCFADTERIRDALGWKPQVSLEEGFRELAAWSATQAAQDRFAEAEKILKEKRLQR